MRSVLSMAQPMHQPVRRMPIPAPAVCAAFAASRRRRHRRVDNLLLPPFGRVNRCAALLQRALDATFGEFGLSSWEFDVLATLRRSGTPYCMTPSALFSALMVTSGTITHRLQRLEASGLVARVLNCDDARSTLVKLSPAGLALTDRALETHVENAHRILAAIGPAELEALDMRLAAWLSVLEAAGKGT